MSEIVEFGRFPVSPPMEACRIRPDRHAIAAVLPTQSRMQVSELSAAGLRSDPPHRAIYPRLMTYSASGRLAYVVGEGEWMHLVLDGEEQSTRWNFISDDLGWSEDGQCYNFTALRDGEVFVVARGHEWQVQGDPLAYRCAQNLDGSRVAWIAQSQRQRLFINGELHWEAEQFIENPVWSPDGKRLAFAFADEGSITIRVDDRSFGSYTSLNKGPLVWSPDSRRCGWVTQRKDKSVVVLDGREFDLPYSVIQGGTLSFAPDGNRWSVAAHAGFMNLRGCVVIDGESEPIYNALGLSPPAWSPHSDRVAYCAIRGFKTCFIVCGNREGQHFTSFLEGSLTWHPNGHVAGCIAQQDKQACIVVEGRDRGSKVCGPQRGLFCAAAKISCSVLTAASEKLE